MYPTRMCLQPRHKRKQNFSTHLLSQFILLIQQMSVLRRLLTLSILTVLCEVKTTRAIRWRKCCTVWTLGKQLALTGFQPGYLKAFARKLSKPLADLFNLSFELGQVPSTWKWANISPVHKDNKRELVINYRSISLLSIPGKCQERLAHDVIYEHVLPYLPEWQHGVMKGRSCATQLLLTHHNWAKALDHGQQVNVVFMDFSKAFDRVFHHILLSKLCNFRISGSLLKWCSSYLSGRKQRVVIDGKYSSWTRVTFGVPQG